MKIIWISLYYLLELGWSADSDSFSNRVNKHDVLQLLLIISYTNWRDSKNKEAKQQYSKKPCFTLFIYFIVKTLLILYRNGHLEISVSPLAFTLFLSYKMLQNTAQYYFLYLVIRHQNPFSTVTHFITICYPASTKLASET